MGTTSQIERIKQDLVTSLHHIKVKNVLKETYAITILPGNPTDVLRRLSWEEALEHGKSYMVGDDMSMQAYLAGHTSRMPPWQRAVFTVLQAFPDHHMERVAGRFEWDLYSRGEYVEFRLPHHGCGGEKSYISRDGTTRVLVNVD